MLLLVKAKFVCKSISRAPGGIAMDTNSFSQENTERKIITTKNSPELKEKMRIISAEIMERNKELYKRLENLW